MENQLDSEISSNLLVRSNMSTKNQLDEFKKLKKGEKYLKSKKSKRTFGEDSEMSKPEYHSIPTAEEIIQTFNLILTSG